MSNEPIFKKLKDPSINKAHEGMKQFLQNNPDMMASYYATILACGKMLGDFILDNNELGSLPREIQHRLALVWNSYAFVYMQEKMIKISFDIDFQNYFESGSVDDRFAMVVKQMYLLCKEEKLL